MLRKLTFAILTVSMIWLAALGCNSGGGEPIKPQIKEGQTQPSQLKPVNAGAGGPSGAGAKPE